ncbi:hypothetical protein CASFOL_017366 [Castilleja foliolosa]|uniref:RING-CH-type domain-containing protein n=1 Tax=Castilleja foliolosa TaxID=1961234 RepID=A0ABD3DEE8_9LAMI
MATLDMTQIDLECGHRSTAAGDEEEEVGSVCFSDGFCNSQFLDDKSLESSKASSVDLEIGIEKIENNNLIYLERDCRICRLSLISSSPRPGSGLVIELGCSCNDDLAVAHKHCAETWFKIKGNKTCEICNSVARNVVGPNDAEAAQEATESVVVEESNTPSDPMLSTTEDRTYSNGDEFFNFLLACVVFGFVISWIFDVNIFG